jgi:hypothetical protein
MIRKLYFDCETSPNVVYSWRLGYNLSIDHSALIEERAIICICYKWEHEDKVHSLTWDRGCDKKMLQRFSKVLRSADIAIAHNGDRFDVKWFRTRCLYHRVDCPSTIVTHDTLKTSKGRFYFNSNRLDYIAQFLGIGKKEDTGGFKLWKDVMAGNRSALKKMVSYCENDVVILEGVTKELDEYIEPKIHAGVHGGGFRHHCPKCGSDNTKRNKKKTTASGIAKIQLLCGECNTYFTLAEASYWASISKEKKAKGYSTKNGRRH